MPSSSTAVSKVLTGRIGSIQRCIGRRSFSLPALFVQTKNLGPLSCRVAGSFHQERVAVGGTIHPQSFSTYTSPLDSLVNDDHVCPVFGKGKNPVLKKPPPKYLECGLREDLLRFKSASFGKTIRPPHIHTNEHRVYLLVDIKDLPLDDLGKQILQQVLGIQRYNVEKGEVKMQAVQFPSRIENKRYLVRLFDKVILACQRLSKSLPETNGDVELDSVAKAAKDVLGETAEAA